MNAGRSSPTRRTTSAPAASATIGDRPGPVDVGPGDVGRIVVGGGGDDVHRDANLTTVAGTTVALAVGSVRLSTNCG